MSWEISYGEIREGAGVNVVIDEPNCKVFEIDFNTKYATGFASFSEDSCRAYFMATEDTLEIDEKKKGTSTTLTIDGQWHNVLADCRRYTGVVCVYRRTGN